MSILGKIGQKIGNAMEKAASNNMTGESKKLYEQEKFEREQNEQEKTVIEGFKIEFNKDDLKNINELIQRIPNSDENALWIAGFSNHRTNQNATAANLFSGKKNLRFLIINQDIFYFAHFVDNTFESYKNFVQSDIKKTEIKSKLLGASTLYVELKDGKVFTIDITENKEKLDHIKNIFK